MGMRHRNQNVVHLCSYIFYEVLISSLHDISDAVLYHFTLSTLTSSTTLYLFDFQLIN